MNAQKESLIAIKNRAGKLIAVVHKDLESLHQIIYRTEEMADEEIASLINKASEGHLSPMTTSYTGMIDPAGGGGGTLGVSGNGNVGLKIE